MKPTRAFLVSGQPVCLHRRDFLARFATGLGGVALASLLGREQVLGAVTSADADSVARPHHPPKAKRAIQIFLQGGLSHVDSFDYKPELAKHHGKALPEDEKPDVFFGKVG